MFSKPRMAPKRPSLLTRFACRPRDRDRMLPLYQTVVAAGRDPFWYREGGVPDTVDGRFNMIAALIAIVLLRYETEEDEVSKHDAVMLTELFIEDMDESLRHIGIGDYVVGKHVGKMMGALGGRLAVFREASRERRFAEPVRRNIYHEAPPREDVVTIVANRLDRFDAALQTLPIAALRGGGLPPL